MLQQKQQSASEPGPAQGPGSTAGEGGPCLSMTGAGGAALGFQQVIFKASRRRVVKLYLRFTALHAIRANLDPRALVRRDDTVLEVVDLRSSHTLRLAIRAAAGLHRRWLRRRTPAADPRTLLPRRRASARRQAIGVAAPKRTRTVTRPTR